MATTSIRAKRSTKAKPAPKPQTLLIRKLSPESIIAIEKAKQDCGTEANTKAAAHMIEDYWFVREALEKTGAELEAVKRAYSSIIRAHEQITDLEKIIKDAVKKAR